MIDSLIFRKNYYIKNLKRVLSSEMIIIFVEILLFYCLFNVKLLSKNIMTL